MKDIKQMRTLSPEWYAEAFRRMASLYKSCFTKLPFPFNLVAWGIMVPFTVIMLTTAVIKHSLIRVILR